MVYAAEGTGQATRLIFNLFGVGLLWGVALPFLVGLAVLVGWVPIPSGLAGMMVLGGGARLGGLLALGGGGCGATPSLSATKSSPTGACRAGLPGVWRC